MANKGGNRGNVEVNCGENMEIVLLGFALANN
jgi:hypothetical protein